MLLKKKVRAGILLYALLMLAVFSLLLQFYIHRQEAESRLVQVARQETTAYIMAQMVLDQVEEDLQERQAVAKEEASQTDERKEDDIVVSETVEKKEVKEAQSTKESQETIEKPAQTSVKKKEEGKLIEDRGTMLFQQGQASYHVQNQQVSVLVVLRDGREYRYQFGMKSRD
ncbi:competence type IV pilus minor pilin ComGG [Streptococcus iners]|uniref:Competence type IV pilus minor pilin ComGG n=1 Tax=Streptococcus iners subsp. hyiners TaxID=3028083 RepID=A0AA96VHJ1_9STRE|nr:competence type IV pilus minor pilin ComGG [Streptococcus sp. 29892]MCK4030499.1 competence protein ComGG [Streptococcus suis]WNY49198.1 competence type IV pilus minor pilin ComGG [Streptococcus sp. 29892]HEL2401288.1 competence protein ComGG [Streptococcus suis]